MKQKNKSLVCIFAILTIIFLTYYPSLFNDFTNWDDPEHLLENNQVHQLSFSNIKEIFKSTVNKTYIPLSIASYSVEYHFFKFNPFIYHLNNLLLHILVTGLVFIFGRQIGLSLFASGFGALLFGIHPMHVESVAWITERKDVLYAFFYMISLCSYWSYLETENKRFYWVSLLMGLFSILSKSMALSLPLILILLDWFKNKRVTPTNIVNKIPFLLYIIPITWITYILNTGWLKVHAEFSKAFAIYIYTFTFYIWKFIVPLELTPVYSLPKPVAIFYFPYSLAFIFFVVILFLIFHFRKERLFIFAWAFYYLSIFFLLRTDTITNLNLVSDRFMYLPSLGFCLLFGFLAHGTMKKFSQRNKWFKSFWIIIMSAVLLTLSAKTYAQTQIWKNGVVLWDHVIKRSPIADSYNNRGEAYRKQGEIDLALADYNKALILKSKHSKAYNNRAEIYVLKGQYELALADYKNAIASNPNYYKAYYNRATVYGKLGKIELALADYNQSLKIEPKYVSSYNNRGLTYLQTKQFEKAIADFNMAISLMPDFYLPYNNRGYAFKILKQYDEVISDCSKAIDLNPHYAFAYYNRGGAYRKTGQLDLAIIDFTKSIELNSDYAPNYLERSLAHRAKNQFTDALKDALKAKTLGGAITEQYLAELKNNLGNKK